jgi:RNA polymerase sigma-70 factor (ECF subfamily)
MSSVTVASVGTRLTQDLEQLFRDNYQLVYRTAYGVTGSTEEAEDVLQTIFLNLLRRGEFPEIQHNPKAYLYRAAVNLSLNTIRSRKRRPFHLTDNAERFDSRVSTDDSEHEEELYRRMYAAIAELEPDVAHLIVLRYVHNYDHAAIARLLGLSCAAVKLRLFRARNRLKKILREA